MHTQAEHTKHKYKIPLEHNNMLVSRKSHLETVQLMYVALLHAKAWMPVTLFASSNK